MLTKIAEIESPIDASQQVIARHVIIEVEQVEKLVLPDIQLTHHERFAPRLSISEGYLTTNAKTTFSAASVDQRHSKRLLGRLVRDLFRANPHPPRAMAFTAISSNSRGGYFQ